MAYASAKVYIVEAETPVNVQLFFPTDLPQYVGVEPAGVITLLHGISNTGQEWQNLTAAYRYASDNNYILVAPEAGNSFYHDMVYGAPWYRILTEYLPRELHRIFNIPTEREKNFLVGNSMGGYGALRIGLLNPDKYAAIASFSGVVDLAATTGLYKQLPARDPLITAVLGDDLEVPPTSDIFHLLEEVSKLPASRQPRIYATTGLQDEIALNILEQNRKLAQFASTLPVDFEYREWEGEHIWAYWDRSLAEFISFIQQSDYAAHIKNDWSVQARFANANI
jgi:putative lysine transport system ATP-binding protein